MLILECKLHNIPMAYRRAFQEIHQECKYRKINARQGSYPPFLSELNLTEKERQNKNGRAVLPDNVPIHLY